MIHRTICKQPKKLVCHGHTRIDNYFWMNDIKNKDVLSFLKDENNICDNVLLNSKKIEADIYNEIITRINIDYQSVPQLKNSHYYYYRIKKNQSYPIYYRTSKLDNIERTILNTNEIVKNEKYGDISNIQISDCENYLLYCLDNNGGRRYHLYIKNIKENTTCLVKKNITSNVIWGRNAKEIFFTEMEKSTMRQNKIYLYNMDTKRKKLVYEEYDKEFYVHITKSKSKKFGFIISSGKQSTEYNIINLSSKYIKIKMFKKRSPNIKYYLEHLGNHIFCKTNQFNRNFAIYKIKENSLGKKDRKFEQVIKGDNKAYITDFEVFKNHIVTVINDTKKKYLYIRDLRSGVDERRIEFKEDFYEINLFDNPDIESSKFLFTYSTLHTPEETYEYDIITKKKRIVKQVIVPHFKKELYDIKRVYVESHDNKKIPLSLLYKKDINISFELTKQKKKTHPTLIYVYGAYGSSISMNFSNSIFSLVDRGFIYAIAHVRGGKELGQEWYDDGRLLKKKNTFFDLIDCGKWFLKNNISKKEELCVLGASAGGLTVSAAMNIDPTLFNSIVAAVPFVDVITTMMDESVPLTTNEYHEWGNPNNKEYYEYMLSYSPYDNISKNVEYPNILLTTALYDSQVQYWEAAKMLAKLKTLKKGNKLCLLKTNLSSGHSGHSDKFLYYKEIAFIYRFFLHSLHLI